MKILCSLQAFVTVAYFVQWCLQHGTYFSDKTQSTEFLRWYLMIVSAIYYKLQYIWICCQFLSQLLKLIFNVIKTGLNSSPSPWEELIQKNLSLKVGNKLGVLSIALAFDEIDFLFHRKLD